MSLKSHHIPSAEFNIQKITDNFISHKKSYNIKKWLEISQFKDISI